MTERHSSSWIPLIVLASIVCACFAAGMVLDLRASDTNETLLLSQEAIIKTTNDPTTGETTKRVSGVMSTDEQKVFLEIQKARADRLHESAKLLYDFAKLALGALIAAATQLIGKGSERNGTERNT